MKPVSGFTRAFVSSEAASSLIRARRMSAQDIVTFAPNRGTSRSARRSRRSTRASSTARSSLNSGAAVFSEANEALRPL